MRRHEYSRVTHPAFFRSAKNFGQLIALIEQEGEKTNNFIVRIALNDRAIDRDEEALLEKMSIHEVNALSVEMGTLPEILRDSLLTTMREIQRIQQLTLKFTKSFRANQKVDDEQVKFVLVETRGLIEALEEIFTSHMSEKWTLRHVPLWKQSENELTNILNGILQARRLSSPELLIDLLEDDFIQALDAWEETLESELLDNRQLQTIFDLKREVDPGDNGVDA